MLASAAVAGYLQGDKHKFVKEAEEFPEFMADLLKEVKIALNSLIISKQAPSNGFSTSTQSTSFKDPINLLEICCNLEEDEG